MMNDEIIRTLKAGQHAVFETGLLKPVEHRLVDIVRSLAISYYRCGLLELGRWRGGLIARPLG